MSARSFDPLRLDVEPFARAGGQLDGRWPMAELPRLQSVLADADEAASGDAVPDDGVVWHVGGERRPVPAGEAETWLRLRASARVALTCQRCLGRLDVPLQLERNIRFVHGEAAAEALDAEIEDDVLATTRALDLRQLVEDELLLALPLVPRHEQCPDGALPGVAASMHEPRENPFAVLAALKKGGGAR